MLSSLALYIPLGVGFDVDGKLTLLQVGFELTTEAKANVFVGVQCPGGSNCGMVNNLDTDVKDEFKWITPDVSTTPLQVLSQFRIEPALSGYLSSGLDLGFIPQLHIPARASMLKAQAGVKLAGNFALVEGQMADEDYSSDYLLSQDSVIGAGVEFNALGGLFQANLLSTTISYTDPLAESPKVLEAVSDVKDFVTGDSVTFTVVLIPSPSTSTSPLLDTTSPR